MTSMVETLIPEWLIDGFNSAMGDCQLMYMELVGYPFTWETGYGSNN